MAIIERRTPEETRGSILAVAWDLIRQLGARTAVADIADKSGMSSANVYRFFPSKQALNEAVCEGLLGESLKAAQSALDRPGTAAERIATMMLTLHRLMRDHMTDQARVHEILQIAMDEVWPPIVDYLHKCAAMLAETIAEGQATGEFGSSSPSCATVSCATRRPRRTAVLATCGWAGGCGAPLLSIVSARTAWSKAARTAWSKAASGRRGRRSRRSW